MQLFWLQGYQATSLQQLLQVTGLSRSSLYELYGSKQALFEAAFVRYVDARASAMLARLEASPSPLAFVHDCLLSTLEGDDPQQPPRGCMLVNVANEFSTSDPAVHVLVATATARFRGVFEEAFRRAQAGGEVAAQAAPETLAAYLHCTMCGLRTQAKSGLGTRVTLGVIQTVMNSLRHGLV